MAAPRKPGKVGDFPDVLTGLMFVGFGALGLWAGRDLTFGTAASMGSGYLPTVVCWLLILAGLCIGGIGLLRARETISVPKLRPLLVILAAIIGFAFGAEYLGFAAASIWLLAIGSIADRESKWREVLFLTAGLTAFGALVFIYALGVQIPVWPF
jgi:Tripartite tricarboxylate transporter TctB family